ncbi:hypothetical protein E4U42_005222 [Claviceps africana]|uniref:LysM domain-containing protein n=1 Tax=Claviceps africana TaxID=83212 RepID=A0A8K0J3V6_9HYPO|nr:hypothetical protein E4U42_005222 [Claviceps africana]
MTPDPDFHYTRVNKPKISKGRRKKLKDEKKKKKQKEETSPQSSWNRAPPALPYSLYKPQFPQKRLQRTAQFRAVAGSYVASVSRQVVTDQVSNTPTSLPQRLRDPPSYAPLAPSSTTSTSAPEKPDPADPPPYTPAEEKASFQTRDPAEKQRVDDDGADDVLHFLNHNLDSITSLSFRYGVPAAVLRHANHLTSDHLLWGRRTIRIPGKYYKGGVSLSPRPVDGEEEERRKSKIRRFMTSCKVSDYDVAVLYLEQSDYDFGLSVEAYLGDEAWEAAHPRHNPAETSSRRRNRGPFWRGLSSTR